MYSDRLALYLGQTAQLQKQTGPDAYGNMQYGEPQEIPVRREGRTRLVRDMNGETVASNTTVFSLAEIAPMDKIDGRLVIDAMSMVDRDEILDLLDELLAQLPVEMRRAKELLSARDKFVEDAKRDRKSVV